MVFGQVVIGPPGSGKTTYCNGMSQFLSLLGRYVRRLVPHYCFGCPSQTSLAKWKWNALGLDFAVYCIYYLPGDPLRDCLIGLVSSNYGSQ